MLQLPQALPTLQSTGWQELVKDCYVFRMNSYLVLFFSWIINVLKVEKVSLLDDLIRWTQYACLF